MAEVIGAIAAVLAILDSTVRALNLISKFRDVPAVVRDLTKQVNQLENVVKEIRSSSFLDPNSEALQSILRNCTIDLSTFYNRLQIVARTFDSGAINRKWGAVVATVKSKDFEEAARKIEGHKTTLLLCLQIQNSFVAILS